MIVVLLGYMGSGKSTIGRALAEKLDLSFLDLDSYIESKQKDSVSTIFKSKGEVYFRNIEATAVKELCQQKHELVLALGGGTPCYSDTISYLLKHPNVFTVMLNTSIESLTERLLNEKLGRPLISDLKPVEIPEFIAKHLFERAPFYTQAEIHVTTDLLSQDKLVDEIISKLL